MKYGTTVDRITGSQTAGMLSSSPASRLGAAPCGICHATA
jgi:hypothetical protein